jgi:hypothetical protein
VCPCASEHLPCCKNCTDGFAVPFEIKQLIRCKLKGDKQQSTTTDSLNPETATINEEGHHNENLKLVTTPAAVHDEEVKIKGERAEEQRGTCQVLVDSECERATTEEGHDANLKLSTPAAIHDETAKNEMTEVDSNTEHCIKIKGERAEERRGTCRVLVDCSKQCEIIRNAFLGAGHDDDIIAQVGSSGHKVTRQAMKSLKPGIWVEDEVINAFFHLLSKRDGELCKNDVTRKRNGFFNSFFVTKLLNEGHTNRSGEYEYGNIRN